MNRLLPCLLMILSVTLSAQQNVQVLVVVPHLYGANHNFNVEMYDEFGWEVTLTGATPVVQNCFWGQPITVDLTLDQITDVTQYDVISISQARWNGNQTAAYSDLIDSPEMMTLLQTAEANNIVIFASCAGVRVLAAADILDGDQVTGQSAYQTEYEAAGAVYLGMQIPPVISGNIVTATRGQCYRIKNNEAVRRALEMQLPQTAVRGGE